MKKILIIVLITGLFIGFCFLLGMFTLLPDLGTASFKKEEIVFPNLKDTLYFHLRSEYKEKMAVLSTSPSSKFEFDTSSEFIYDLNSSPILYKKVEDSLVIYTMTLSKFPINFASAVKVIQVEVDNPKMMDMIENMKNRNISIKKFE